SRRGPCSCATGRSRRRPARRADGPRATSRRRTESPEPRSDRPGGRQRRRLPCFRRRRPPPAAAHRSAIRRDRAVRAPPRPSSSARRIASSGHRASLEAPAADRGGAGGGRATVRSWRSPRRRAVRHCRKQRIPRRSRAASIVRTMANRLSQIATRTGDDGTAALGDVDELNSHLGVLLCEPLPDEVRKLLVVIQQELFNLGGELSIPGYELLKSDAVAALDAALARYNADLP